MITLTTEAPTLPAEELAQKLDSARLVRQEQMRFLIAGAGGMIGSTVAAYLASRGHMIVSLMRHEPGIDEMAWDPDLDTIEAEKLEAFDGVVHVASLPQARWTPTFIKRWRDNHVGTNRLLAETLAKGERKPRVLVCASAQGIYAPSNENILTEDSPLGTDYLAELLRDGEEATAPAFDEGIRVVHLRIPTVLSRASLAAMSSNIRQLGSGRQWFSWIARDEMGRIVEHTLVTDTIAGPVNATNPKPCTRSQALHADARISATPHAWRHSRRAPPGQSANRAPSAPRKRICIPVPRA